MKQTTLILIGLMFCQAMAWSQPCLQYGITFSTQSQIDSFQINHPGCTEIEGDVIISGVDITNLNGLSVLTSIGGYLWIEHNDTLNSLTGLENLAVIEGNLRIRFNNALVTLLGLDNVTYIGGHLSFLHDSALVSLSGLENLHYLTGSLASRCNPSLNDFVGLDNLDSIGGALNITENNALTSLSGLEILLNLTSIGGDLGVYGNASLTSLTALNNLTSIGGDLLIGGNDSLPNLTGLNNLTFIQGSISIGLSGFVVIDYGNPLLTSLTGIDNIEAVTIQDLHIFSNPLLSTCEVSSICEYLASPGGTIDIHDNATGCNSQQEVEDACATIAINEIGFEDEFSMFPVPVESTLTISSKNNLRIDEIVIYNQIGQNVLHHKPVTQTIDVSTLRPGMYVIEVEAGNRKLRGKFIK